VRDVAEIVLHRQDLAVDRRDREVGQLRLAQHQREAAALGDLQRVGQCAGHVGKQGLHFSCRLEILLARETAHATRVGQDFAFGNADTGLVGFVVIRSQKLHRVRGHHWQVQAGGQLHRGLHMRLVFGAAGTLQLQVKAVRKNRGQLQRQIGGLVGITLDQRLPHRAGLRTRQQDQSLRKLLQPFQLNDRLRLDDIFCPAAGQQFTQIEVALLALHQQDDARNLGQIARQAFELNFRTQDGFDPFSATFLVELDTTKQVVQVGDGQGRLSVFGCPLDDIVDAAGGVDDGKLGVKAQMDKHGRHFRPPPLSPSGHAAPQSEILGCKESGPPVPWPRPAPAVKKTRPWPQRRSSTPSNRH